MKNNDSGMNRRSFLSTLGGLAAWGGLAVSDPPLFGTATVRPRLDEMHTKAIPSSGEEIPVIGLGTYITFNVGTNTRLRNNCADIMEAFFERGGGMIDSSPMYGSSEEVIGYGLDRLDSAESLFSATKIWTRRSSQGPVQIDDSLDLWRIREIDLMQVHNLLNWQDHLKTIREYKDEGIIRYSGVTTSHGRRHRELEQIMQNESVDFIQLTYNVLDRQAENRLLPLAKDRGIAVIANRPFRRKQLFHQFGNDPLPDWVSEIDVENWAQFFLKFIVSHPAITCAIPATSQLEHLHENMGALYGKMPDEEQRRRMAEYVESL